MTNWSSHKVAAALRIAVAVVSVWIATPSSAGADDSTPAPGSSTQSSAGTAESGSGTAGSAATGDTTDRGTGGSGAATGAAPAEAGAGASTGTSTASESPSGTKRTALTQELAEKGEQELNQSVRVFQQRFLVKAGRAELQLGGSLTLADPMVAHYGADADLLYHLSEQWAVGLGGSKWFGSKKPEFEQIQRDFGLFAEQSLLQAGGHAEVQFSPVVGKFASFGLAVMQVDAYLLAGGGAARTTRGESLKPYGMIGVGARIHTARWLSVSVEVRDLIINETFLNEDRILQHVFAGLKLGLWLPPTVTYKYAR